MLQVIAPADHRHRPLGTSSARECLTMLRRICKYAAHLRLIRPMEICVSLPQTKSAKIQPLSKEEQARMELFICKAPTARKVGLMLQMQLGLRIGEVCGLQWGDFDLKAGTLTVQRTVSRISTRDGHTKVVIQSPKTRSSRREVPIPRNLIKMLQGLRGDAEPEVWFLSGNAEKPVEPRCYRKSIQIYLRQAAVRKVRPHTPPPYVCHHLPAGGMRHQDFERVSWTCQPQRYPTAVCALQPAADAARDRPDLFAAFPRGSSVKEV